MKYLCLLAMVGLIFSGVYAQSDCGLESQLVTGAAGYVTPGEANNVRITPEQSAVLVGQIEGTQAFGVLEGRTCGEGFRWVEVEFVDNGEVLTGWTVEATADAYFVEPLEGIFVGAANGVTSVSLVLPPEVAGAAEVLIEEGTPVDEADPYAYSPAYIEISFAEDYPDEDYFDFNLPAIRVFASDAFANDETIWGDSGEYAASGMVDFMEERPDLSTAAAPSYEDLVPDFSPGAVMLLLAHGDYLDFASGSGIRYLTYYGQDYGSPNNSTLLYRYQGLTTDGAYFVDSTLPIDAPDLPIDGFELADGTDEYWIDYMEDSSAFFSEIPLEDYTPDLTKLDAVIASLWVEGVEAE